MYIKSIKNQIDYKMNFILKCKSKTILNNPFYQNKKYISFEPCGSTTLQVFVSRTFHQHSAMLRVGPPSFEGRYNMHQLFVNY